MTSIAQALKIRRLTREYQTLNKLNATEKSKADKATITARLKRMGWRW